MARRKFETSSKIRLKSCYSPSDVTAADRSEGSLPGEFPFTRGIHPEMYRSKLWTMRQYAGFGTAADSNARFKYLLGLGQTGLSVAFDLPTQMGLDSSSPFSVGEVGRVGVAIDTLKDMESLLEGIPLEKVSLSMTINATAAILLAMVAVVARKRGIALELLSGTVQNDILKEYVSRGTYVFPPLPSLRLTTDVIRYCAQALPRWNPVSISGYHIREAGATAVQEVAFTLCNGITYVDAALRSGLCVDDFATRLSFFFNVQNNFLEEVAKFRAARILWAKIMRFRFGADPHACKLRFHAQTAGSTLTAQQPEVNAVRVSLQALAAVLGGAQSLHTNSRDEALSLPTEEGARLALRTQQVIAYETGIAEVVDPLGGSYAVEVLTREIEERAREYIDKIETMGGMLAAITSGYIQREIQQSAYEFQKEIESKERIVVGVNEFQSAEQKPIPLHSLDPSLEAQQIKNLESVKSARDDSQVANALDVLEAAAKTEAENLMPRIVEAVEAYASIGEICGRLRCVFGEHRENLSF